MQYHSTQMYTHQKLAGCHNFVQGTRTHVHQLQNISVMLSCSDYHDCGWSPVAVPVSSVITHNKTLHTHQSSLVMKLSGYFGADTSLPLSIMGRRYAAARWSTPVLHAVLLYVPHNSTLSCYVLCPAGYHSSMKPRCVLRSVRCSTWTSSTQGWLLWPGLDVREYRKNNHSLLHQNSFAVSLIRPSFCYQHMDLISPRPKHSCPSTFGTPHPTPHQENALPNPFCLTQHRNVNNVSWKSVTMQPFWFERVGPLNYRMMKGFEFITLAESGQ